jgi:hypothetical protein
MFFDVGIPSSIFQVNGVCRGSDLSGRFVAIFGRLPLCTGRMIFARCLCGCWLIPTKTHQPAAMRCATPRSSQAPASNVSYSTSHAGCASWARSTANKSGVTKSGIYGGYEGYLGIIAIPTNKRETQMSRVFGYTRVSTLGQTVENQIAEIRNAGFDIKLKRCPVVPRSSSGLAS